MSNENEAKLQLFLLPFAGGDSTSFRKLTDLLDARIDCFTVAYAGRGNRRKEPLFTDYSVFLDDVRKQIQKVRRQELPFACLGYSAGAVYTYELLSHHDIPGKLIHTFLCSKGRI